MAQNLSSYLNIDPNKLEKEGVFDAIIGVDTNLFLDPFLLKKTRIPEFKNSRKKIEKYFENIIVLISAVEKKKDRAWKEAFRRLNFKETHGASIGYSIHSSDGSGIGPGLALRLIDSASEIIEMGIKDPEIFELLGLFEEGFGADRLSDMTISIIIQDIYAFSERMTGLLNIKDFKKVDYGDSSYELPKHPNKRNKPLLLLPGELLRDLPVALTWEGIDHVVAVNTELRNRLNELIGSAWKSKIKKKELREYIFSSKENIEDLISTYKSSDSDHYDFKSDPAGKLIWYKVGKTFADQNPVSLQLIQDAKIDQFEAIVKKIILQFKKNIEENGLKEHLYVKHGFVNKRRPERFSQLLFYATADTYCEANNLDISREPNAGNGPVDFKLSRGHKERVLVEIKLSSNKNLLHGFKKQIPAYEASEGTKRSFYVILRITESYNQIKELLKLQEEIRKKQKRIPEIVIIDARLTPSASKR